MRRTQGLNWVTDGGELVKGRRISFIYVFTQLFIQLEEFLAYTTYAVLSNWYMGCDLNMISAIHALDI